ncbi:MAG: hypothetical protein IKZ61_11890 [Prevotella sp.]|nr:hypothetical protein [Prevotella sp.]
MADVNIQEIVDEVLATIAQGSIDSTLGFSIDSDGYLCVDTTVDTSQEEEEEEEQPNS